MAPRSYRLGARGAAKEATRRRIVEAVVDLHGEKGVLATRFEDIARRADVAVGTVYRHFPALDDVVRACGGRISEITRPPAPGIFEGVEARSRRVELLVRELFAFYGRAARWLERARSERAAVPALDAGMRAREAQLEAVVREALGPLAADERIVGGVLALTDFGVWKSLVARGAGDDAAGLVVEALVAWLEKSSAPA
ncbi:MAG: TetR/AcrR family transcriptional regulator [Candidatus Rokubacteria bacterium]|nr:TetR/AcrR family transcriptional regulator [Candidatus Rokubacteria bacterium]